MSSDRPHFWNERYRSGRTPWDLGRVPPALLRFLQREKTPGRVLLPGCGTGYEVKAFHEHGWDPVAVDFSEAAVERARQALGPLSSRVRLADFFRDDPGGPFDLIFEHALLCALPRERWPDYARRVAELLAPGRRLAGLFVFGEEPEPPPYPIREHEIQALLGPAFERVGDEPVPAAESPAVIAGMERWQVWRRGER